MLWSLDIIKLVDGVGMTLGRGCCDSMPVPAPTVGGTGRPSALAMRFASSIEIA